MKKTIIVQNVGSMQITVCDKCQKEASLPAMNGWARLFDYRTSLLQDVCKECLTGLDLTAYIQFKSTRHRIFIEPTDTGSYVHFPKMEKFSSL
jgi:hypothetical protein